MKASEQRKIFETWLHEYKGVLFKVVRAYAFTTEDQDDLFQEITIQIWHSVPRYRGEAAITTWLYRISLYVALSWTRKEKKHRTGKQGLDGIAHTLTSVSGAGDPRLDWLYGQIAKLNPIDRSLMLLVLEGFSYKEMATILGISESNVGVKINRIKKRLTHQSREATNHGL
ncbi:RNA polymerase sigma factor [Rhodocaloribacter sp.]